MIRDCHQEQCYFFRRECKPCQDCGCGSHHVNEKCKDCFKCENIPGNCRWEEGRLTDFILNKYKNLLDFDNQWAN